LGHLKYASLADEWFQEIGTEKLMWKEVEAKILEQFPPVERAKRMETKLHKLYINIHL